MHIAGNLIRVLLVEQETQIFRLYHLHPNIAGKAICPAATVAASISSGDLPRLCL